MTASTMFHDHGRCSVRELSPLLDHGPGINCLLTFETLPHTRLLNIILKHFYLVSPMDSRFYHTIFLDFIVILFRPFYLLSAAVHQFVGGAIQISLIDWLIDWLIDVHNWSEMIATLTITGMSTLTYSCHCELERYSKRLHSDSLRHFCLLLC